MYNKTFIFIIAKTKLTLPYNNTYVTRLAHFQLQIYSFKENLDDRIFTISIWILSLQSRLNKIYSSAE